MIPPATFYDEYIDRPESKLTEQKTLKFEHIVPPFPLTWGLEQKMIIA